MAVSYNRILRVQPFPVIFYGRKWRAALRGQANPANWPIYGKIAKTALFNPCMELKNILGQMTSFEVFKI